MVEREEVDDFRLGTERDREGSFFVPSGMAKADLRLMTYSLVECVQMVDCRGNQDLIPEGCCCGCG